MPENKEEEYFRRREIELLHGMRREAGAAAGRKQLMQALGTGDEAVAAAFEQAGFNAETAPLADVVPMLYVAWADGSVSGSEHERMREFAGRRGPLGGAALERLASWVEKPPAESFWRASLAATANLLAALPEVEREVRRRELLESCDRVAAASGGILGIGKISPEERRRLAEVTDLLGGPITTAA